MPNHCESDLYLKGPINEVRALRAFMGVDKDPAEFDLGAIAPYPEEFALRDRLAREAQGGDPAAISEYALRYGTPTNGVYMDGFNNGGYEWRNRVWGTKWGAYDVHSERERTIHFTSAWCPPNPGLLVLLSARFPSLRITLKWYESGAAERGEIVCCGASLVRNEQFKYHGRRGG